MKRLIPILLILLAVSAQAAVPNFCGDTARGKAHHNCSNGDGDNDGWKAAGDGGTGWYTSGSATANGGESSGVHSITVDAGHTIKSGAWVTIPTSGGDVQKHIILATSTQLTFVGNLTGTVADNATITAIAATDCDDTNMWQYPGTWTTDGCSAGQHRQCQPTGSYGACKTITCSDFSVTDSCKWIDGTSGDDANSGTEASPYKSFAKVSSYYSTKPSGHYQLLAGDAVIVKGTVSDLSNYYYGAGNPWDRRILGLRGTIGTAENPIRIVSYSGQRAVIDPGTYTGSHVHCSLAASNESSEVFSFLQTSNVLVEDFDFQNSNFDGGGHVVMYNETTDTRFLRLSVINHECYRNDNCATIGPQSAGTYNDEVAQSVIESARWYSDNNGYYCTQTGTVKYDVSGTNTGSGAGGFEGIASSLYQVRPDGNLWRNNVVWTDVDTVTQAAGSGGYGAGGGMFYKHSRELTGAGAQANRNHVIGNIIVNAASAIATTSGKITVEDNRAIESEYLYENNDHGGITQSADTIVRNNTGVVSKGCLFWDDIGEWSWAGVSYAGTCGNTDNVGPFEYSNNVCVSSDKWMTIDTYGPKQQFDLFVAATKTFNTNTYWKAGANSSSTLFDVYAANTSCGTGCSQRKCWGSSTTMATMCSTFGLECTDSVIEDPQLDSDHIATTTASLGRGWSTTDSPTTTTTTIPNGLGVMRKWSSLRR